MFSDFLNFLFPRSCVHCAAILNENENALCLSCDSKIFSMQPKVSQDILSQRNPLLNVFDNLYSLALYEKGNVVQKSIYALKYKRQGRLGYKMGVQIGEYIRDLRSDFDLIIPIPIDKKKTRVRTFNQSKEIADGIASVIAIEINHNEILYKPISTNSQSKKSRTRRWDKSAFAFKGKCIDSRLNRKILLVDDVLTTGNTLLACQQTLSELGYTNISAVTFAYA